MNEEDDALEGAGFKKWLLVRTLLHTWHKYFLC